MIEIIHEDPWFIALNKPTGLFTQAARNVPSLEVELRNFLRHRSAVTSDAFVGTVHRLDRPTSGLILFALNARALRQLNDQFRERTVEKRYWAVVRGDIPANGRAVDWMRKIPDVAKAEICSPDDTDARQALLQWQVLSRHRDVALAEIELQTGRMHQIRLQFATRGWPIIGDPVYSEDQECFDGEEDFNADANSSFPSQTASSLFGLHSATLRFRHPKSAKMIDLKAKPPQTWFETWPDLLTPIRDD